MDFPLDPSGFEARRSAVWAENRPWIAGSVVLLCAAIVMLKFAGAQNELTWLLAVASVTLGAATIARIVKGLNALYRCPNCGTLPYQDVTDYKCGGLGPTRRDFMSPTACPNCGTRLR
jgi:predicted RNA-binding Zn-ribbon protein involved in translation (DUF1610 family)